MPHVIKFTADLDKNFITTGDLKYCLGIPNYLDLVDEFTRHLYEILMNYCYVRRYLGAHVREVVPYSIHHASEWKGNKATLVEQNAY